MTLNIIQITQQISMEGFDVSPGWPSFAKWIKSQLPLRDITCYLNKRYPSDGYMGYRDQYSSEGSTGSDRQTELRRNAVLSRELEGLLRAPPLNVSQDQAKEYRNHLVNMGLLASRKFDPQEVSSYSVIQFRV